LCTRSISVASFAVDDVEGFGVALDVGPGSDAATVAVAGGGALLVDGTTTTVALTVGEADPAVTAS
jgi:hypothetical protein